MSAVIRANHSDLVELAYAAIDDPSRWQPFAEALARHFEATQAAVVIGDDWEGTPAIAAWSRPDDGAVYLAQHRRLDPFLAPDLVEQMSRTPRAWFSHELIGDSELRASAFYADYLRPAGNLFWGCGGNYVLADGTRLQFGVLRDKALGRYDETDRAALDDLTRHVQRAARLALRLARLQRDATHAAALQDDLLDASMVLDPHDRIVQHSRHVPALLDGFVRDGHFAPRMLRLAGSAEQLRLAAALARAQHGDAPAQSLRLVRQKPLPALYVVILSAARTRDGAVHVFLRDPRWQQHLPEHALCELFQLTQAQARVCGALTRGEPADRIAAELGVAVNTVRSHIKLAMERIGVNRQSDLVRHLGAALPALSNRMR